MSGYAVTLSCNSCKQRFRLTRMEPSVIVAAPNYCPICGAQGVGAVQDAEQDFWEAMARAYNMKIKLLKLLYEVWNEEQPPRFQRFGDFIADAIATAS